MRKIKSKSISIKNRIKQYSNTFLLILILFVAVSMKGQASQNYQLPKIVHSSPNAQNFERYGEIPVDFSTGIPNIDIPLYTIKGRTLTLPLSISYHASGIKVNDIASEVGLGWVLNGKGIISRTANGKRDEAKSTVRRYNNSAHLLQDLNDHYKDYECSSQNFSGAWDRFNFYNTLFVDEQDAMSDRYFYKIPGGESGVFVYDYSVFTENENSVITLPYRPIKIKRNFSYIPNNSPAQDASFEITDENGNIYTFSPYTINDNSSEWYLTQIKSADGTENITFNYTRQNPQSSIAISSTIYRGRVENYQGQPCTASQIDGSVSYQGTPVADFTTPILNSIVTDNEIITFTYDSRTDFSGLKRLKSISVALRNSPAVISKKIQFYEKYFGSANDNRRLGLDYITITAPGSSDIQKYAFKYNESTMLPPYPQKMTSLRFSEDLWGYANGQSNYTNIPKDYIVNQSERQSYGALRDAATYDQSASACMLQEIKYPTGGKSVFEFDRFFSDNLYSYREYDHEKKGYLGGFRVKKISNYKNDSDPNPEIKTYVYEGAMYKAPNFTYFRKPQQFLEKILIPPPYNEGYQPTECWAKYTADIVYSSPLLSMDVSPGLPIMYTSVTEYIGTLTNNAGKTVYSYGFPYSPADYYAHDHPFEAEAPWYYHPYHYDKGNFIPQLQSKEVYDNTNKILYKEYNHYNSFFTNTFTTGIKLTQDIKITSDSYFLAVTLNGTSGCCQCTGSSNTCNAGGACIDRPLLFKNSIVAVDTKAIQEATLLDYSVRTTYDRLNPNKSVSDSIHYVYNQHNLKIKEISTVNSLGQTILTAYKYPYDFGTTEPYLTMLGKRMLTPVIQETVTNNNVQIQKTETAYKSWGNNIIAPEIVKGQLDIQSPFENRIRFLSYDEKSNPLSLRKENGSPFTYLWGYNKTLPIAMVENSNLVSQAGIDNQDKTISGNLYIPMGSTVYELGTFTITEEKNYKIDRTYEKIPNDKSVMYQIQFENLDNGYTVSFTDSTPYGGNSHTFTTQAQLLKPGTYKVKLINIGYNGYQGSIEHQFNFTIYNPVNINRTIPFHTSFEDDSENVSTTQAKTGIKSHIGQYHLKLPTASAGYDKVIVSYWGKSTDSSPWEYVENVVNVTGQDLPIGLYYYYIDEVRVYPVDAMMTTYTYDPFHKGQTSITKQNNQTEYYDYDAFGKLKEVYIIEDNVKKILKSTSYHYKP